jgi:hypothetical protein
MAILQSKLSELRYLKRQNLEQEAKIMGNYYRDIIRSYGIDCYYYKLNTNNFDNYTNIIDQNTILKHAYGYDVVPEYELSVNMLTYMEVENDIFQLQKYGLNPNVDVNFYFDAVDFACDLAIRCGQFKEYKIEEIEITCEVPEMNETSDYTFPFDLGLGKPINYKCDILTGNLSVALSSYEIGKEQTILCDPFEHTDFKVEFPVNNNLYKSFKHKIKNDSYLTTLISLTYKVDKVLVNPKATKSRLKYKYILTGKIHGGILFYDINSIGKYLDKIHPEVGDIVIIDFPDEKNRERYEITDCFDKQLTNDGISPLLHNYVWKCKARRYVSANEDIDIAENDGDNRVEEKQRFETEVKEEITNSISLYPNQEDAVYGGYDMPERKPYDIQTPNPETVTDYNYLSPGIGFDIITFAAGSKLTTDGYDLFFVKKSGDIHKLTSVEHCVHEAYFESGLRFIKATDKMLVFVNIEGVAYKIIEDSTATQYELQLCLNSMFDKTLDTGNINNNGDNFYKFKESKTLLWATEENLYCKLVSNNVLYKLV